MATLRSNLYWKKTTSAKENPAWTYTASPLRNCHPWNTTSLMIQGLGCLIGFLFHVSIASSGCSCTVQLKQYQWKCLNALFTIFYQAMSLEHLDSEFLFWGTFQKLFMFILMSFTWLISHKMALFLKKVKILCTEKLAFFTVTPSWGRSFEKTNCSVFMKFGYLMFFGV